MPVVRRGDYHGIHALVGKHVAEVDSDLGSLLVTLDARPQAVGALAVHVAYAGELELTLTVVAFHPALAAATATDDPDRDAITGGGELASAQGRRGQHIRRCRRRGRDAKEPPTRHLLVRSVHRAYLVQ